MGAVPTEGSDVRTEPRNHLIDAARAASILMVIVFHNLLYQFDSAGGQTSRNPWDPANIYLSINWFVMILPVFFIAGGFGHAILADRMRQRGTRMRDYLARRGRRLAGPVLLFILVTSTAVTTVAWSGAPDLATQWSLDHGLHLWFIVSFLLIVPVAPWLVRAHDRWGWKVIVTMFALAAVLDWFAFRSDFYLVDDLNGLVVWPLCHQLGIAYHRGWFRRGERWQPITAIIVGALAIVWLIGFLGYPPTAMGIGPEVNNSLPPTIAMGFLGLAQAGGLGLLERAGVLRTIPQGLKRALDGFNTVMVTLYVWHITCILIAAYVIMLVTNEVPVFGPFLRSFVGLTLVSLSILAALAPWLNRLGYWLIAPQVEGPATWRALPGYILLAAGTTSVWFNGTVIHPAKPWSSLAMVMVVTGAVLLATSEEKPVLRAP